MDTEAARTVITVRTCTCVSTVFRKNGYRKYCRCQRATVVVDADKRRHPVRVEIATERLIQLSSACLRYDPRGYGILEQSVDGPSRLAHVVDQIRVRVSPGERCRRHPAVIILPEAIRLVPTAKVHRLDFGRKRRRRQYHSNDTGVFVYS